MAMTHKEAIKLFEERKVRTVWDDKEEIHKGILFYGKTL